MKLAEQLGRPSVEGVPSEEVVKDLQAIFGGAVQKWYERQGVRRRAVRSLYIRDPAYGNALALHARGRGSHTSGEISHLSNPVNAQRWTVLQAFLTKAGQAPKELVTYIDGSRAAREWQGRQSSRTPNRAEPDFVITPGWLTDNGVEELSQTNMTIIRETVVGIRAEDGTIYEDYPLATSIIRVTNFSDLPAAARRLAHGYGELYCRPADESPESRVAQCLGVSTLEGLEFAWGEAMRAKTPRAAGAAALKLLQTAG